MKRHDPALQVLCLRWRRLQRHPQCAARALDQRRAQVRVTAPAAVTQVRLATGTGLTRREPQPGAELTAMPKQGRIGHRGDERTGGEHPDTQHFAHALRGSVIACVRGDRDIAARNARGQRLELRACLQSSRGRSASGSRASSTSRGSALSSRSLDGAITMPNSVSRPRSRLISAVRSSLKPARARCHDRIACCATRS